MPLLCTTIQRKTLCLIVTPVFNSAPQEIKKSPADPEPRPPLFHLMIGAAASGKSTASRLLARALQKADQVFGRFFGEARGIFKNEAVVFLHIDFFAGTVRREKVLLNA